MRYAFHRYSSYEAARRATSNLYLYTDLLLDRETPAGVSVRDDELDAFASDLKNSSP